MPATNKVLICAALTTALQGSPCFGGDDHTKLSGSWKLVAFMTEDIDNKVRENVCDKQAEGYLRVCPKTSGGITKFSEHEAD